MGKRTGIIFVWEESWIEAPCQIQPAGALHSAAKIFSQLCPNSSLIEAHILAVKRNHFAQFLLAAVVQEDETGSAL